MAVPCLSEALKSYQVALQQLSSAPDLDRCLTVLYARDTLQAALSQVRHLRGDRLQEIQTLDQILKHQANTIAALLDLPQCRATLPQSTDQWWWHLETAVTVHPRDRWDRLWNGLTVVLWPFNFAFSIDLVRRFFVGGAGLDSALAIALPTLVALLQSDSPLAQVICRGFDQALGQKYFDRWTVPHHWRAEAKFASSLFTLVTLVNLWIFARPALSRWYNFQGVRHSYAGQLVTAERWFDRSIALNLNNFDAHYNLGSLYEALQELEQAQRQYQIAIKGNVSHAYNNLARLLIQDGNYAQAAVLLLQGIDWADQGESPLEIRYSLFKNLGWARFAQGERDAEAQQWLNVAISILENATEVEALYIKHPASAYCLMAQVLERQQRPAAEVLEFWQKCSDTGSSYNAEEDPWLHMARQRLGLN